MILHFVSDNDTTMYDDSVIEARNLSKKYGKSYVLKDLNLEIKRGDVFGFLGPNGAGKTTTIALLTGVLKPTEGDVYLFGKKFSYDYFNLKERIGIAPEYPYVYNDMNAYEYLSFFAELYGIKNKKERVDEMLKLFDLDEHKNKLLKKFSKGMKQKISISRALIHDPEILFLDEPIQGLDPMGIKEIRDIILDQKREGKTIFISSHILSEVERICDNIGIINEGKLLMKGEMNELKKSVSKGMELEVELDHIVENIITSLKGFSFIDDIRIEGNILRIKMCGDEDHRREISNCISKGGGLVLGMRENKLDLEGAFVEITKDNVDLLS